jgi:hypothetical protein
MTGTKVAATVEYSVIDLRYEYPGFVGSEKYAVISDLSAREIEKLYGDELKPYIPYVVLSVAEGDAMKEFCRNEDKHAKRQKRSVDAFGYEEGVTEMCHEELIQDNLFDVVSDHLDKEKLFAAMSKLPNVQKRRIEMHFFDGLSIGEIANKEGHAKSTVHESVSAGLKKLKALMDEAE